MPQLRLPVLAFGCALLVGCTDAFSPKGVSGFYELVSINGQPLPFSEILDHPRVIRQRAPLR